MGLIERRERIGVSTSKNPRFTRRVVDYSENMIAATLDPEGCRVVLGEREWTHIKRRHPELSRNLREILATVREPDRRAKGRSRREAWYFAEQTGRFPWLQVVVHYERGEGWIVTAFARTVLPER